MVTAKAPASRAARLDPVAMVDCATLTGAVVIALGHHAAAVLGNDLAAGAAPQLVVPAGCWQSARSTGAWTLAGCTVAPGFVFSGFELAPPAWEPAGG